MGVKCNRTALAIVVSVIIAVLTFGLTYHFIVNVRDLDWKQIGGDLNGTSNRAFFGASVSLNNDGSVLATLSVVSKNAYFYENETWVEVYFSCSKCPSIYGPGFNYTEGQEVGGDASLSHSGDFFLFSSAYFNMGAAKVVELHDGENEITNQSIFFGNSSSDQFGVASSISGDGTRVAIAALKGSYVYVYDKISDSAWELTGAIFEPNLGYFRSKCMHMSGNGGHIAISFQGQGQGVNVYKNLPSGEWVLQGEKIVRSKMYAYGFGVSLSESGHRVVVSDPYNGNGTLHVLEYDNEQNKWLQLGQIMHGNQMGDNFGFSVSMSADGSSVAGGTYGYATGNPIWGYAKVFDYAKDEWVQRGSDIVGKQRGSGAGFSIALSGNGKRIAVGEIHFPVTKDPLSSTHLQGQVRVFELI